MGWRFRRSFSILPGIRFNLGKTGTSWSFGRRGFQYTIGKTGTRTTIGIPGTGLSHTTFNKYNTLQTSSQTPPHPAAHPPPVPTAPGASPTPIGQPKRNGKAFFIIGGSIFGVAVLANIINSGSKTSSRPTVQPQVAVSTPVATPAVASTALATASPPATIARPVATPAQANVTPAMQQQVAKAAPVIKEPHPPSDNYVPPYVKVTSSVNVPIMKNGKQIGATLIPAGTQVKLDKINGMTVNVTYEGETKKISASSTDLLPRMLGTADDYYPQPTPRLATPAPMPAPSPTPTPFPTPGPLVSIDFKNGAIYYGRVIVKSPAGITFQVDGIKVHKIPASLLADTTVRELALRPNLAPR